MSIDVVTAMNVSSDVFNLLEIIFGSFMSAGCPEVILLILCVYVLTDTSTRTTKLSFGYKLSQAAGNALLYYSGMKLVINLVSPDYVIFRFASPSANLKIFRTI